MTEPQERFRLGTLNVHDFSDADFLASYDAIVALLKAARLDALAVQEAPSSLVPKLASLLGDWSWVAARNTAVLSPHAITAIDPGVKSGVGARPGKTSARKSDTCNMRHCRAHVFLGAAALEVVSVHLDYKREPAREKEVRALVDKCSRWHAARGGSGALAPAVWLGDYNALTRSDYTDGEWAEVASVRARGAWEAPVSHLTDGLIRGGLRMVDARQAAAKTGAAKGPRSTCRYDTRIDYCFLTPQAAAEWAVVESEHVVAMPHASDHNLVVTTLRRIPRDYAKVS